MRSVLYSLERSEIVQIHHSFSEFCKLTKFITYFEGCLSVISCPSLVDAPDSSGLL